MIKIDSKLTISSSNIEDKLNNIDSKPKPDPIKPLLIRELTKSLEQAIKADQERAKKASDEMKKSIEGQS